MSYTARFTSEIVGGGLAETRMDYMPTDPLVIHVEFTQNNTGHIIRWQFGRDLVLAGMTSHEWVGMGDVLVRRTEGNDLLGEDVVEFALETPSGRALLLLPLIDLSRFVGRTLVEMPLGDELVATDSLATSEFAE